MLKTILFVVFAVIVTALVSEYFAFKKQSASNQKHRHEISVLKRDKKELETLKLASDQELERAKACIVDLEEWKSKAIQCSPEIDTLVRFKMAKKEADNFLATFPAISSIEAKYTNYPILVKVIEAYKVLSNEAKIQTHVSIEFLEKQRDTAFSDYIRTTTEYMQKADNSLDGIPEHLPQLTQIMEWFNNIPVSVRSEISGNLIISLSMKEAHAKYLTGLKTEAIDKDEEPQNTSILSKLFVAISNVSSQARDYFGKFFKEKSSKFRDLATTPFNYKFPEDILDAEETTYEKIFPVNQEKTENE